MVKQKNVCVIGAGVAGLAAAKTFGARGHKVTILERSGDLGGVWEPARSYPDVQTQSPKELYRYTDKPMPDSYPEWPKGPQVHAYLADYAREHGLTPRMRFKSAVVGMARRNSGQFRSVNQNSEYAICHNKKLLTRISPLVRINRSGSGNPAVYR